MKAYSQDLRTRVIQADLDGERTQEQVAERFSVSRRTVSSWLKLLDEQGDLLPVPTQRGPQTKISGPILECLERLSTQHPDATLDELSGELFEETGVFVSTSSIFRALKKLNITRKKTLVATERARPDVLIARYQYCVRIERIPLENLLFLDESGSNLAMTRRYARSPKGTRAQGSAPRNWGKNTTMLAAISLAGIVGAVTVSGSVNGPFSRPLWSNGLRNRPCLRRSYVRGHQGMVCWSRVHVQINLGTAPKLHDRPGRKQRMFFVERRVVRNPPKTIPAQKK